MISKYKIKPYNSIYTIYKIPFNVIDKANVSLKDKDNSYSVEKHSIEQGWDIGINGAMFSNGNKSTDPYYYWNLTDMVIKGKLNRGGNYSDKGMAFGNPFGGIGAYWSTTANCIGKQVDFIGGAPTLLIDGRVNMDMKGLSQSFATQITQRTAIGIDKANIYIILTLGNKCNLNSVAVELQKQGCLDAIDLDGGGSTALYADGKTIYTKGRNVTSAFGIKLKATQPTQPQPTPPTSRQEIYTVKKGDTLSKIGKLYNISYKTIAKDNNIKAPFYVIKTGQEIIINKEGV